MSDDALVRELGKELPYERPDDARREAVRASLLAAASRRDEIRPQRWRVVVAFGAGALAAAAVALVVIGRREPAPVEHARIEASAGAELEHTVAKTASGTDEIVRVHGGKVRVAVAPAKAGDRVAIETSDATVDGAGAYEVAVREDRLAAVTVTQGTARVMVNGQKAVFLAAGQAWHGDVWSAEITPTPAPALAPPGTALTSQTPAPSASASPSASATPAPSTTPSPSPSIRTATPPTLIAPTPPAMATSEPAPVAAPPVVAAVAEVTQGPVPVAADRTEEHFQRGWKLLKTGKAIEAAAELGKAAEGEGPLAIDARYFQAEALVKAGRKTEAERALVGFLDRATQSLRRGRAAVMLARLIAERGDATSARAWFESAVGDGDPAVAAAARAGLAALE